MFGRHREHQRVTDLLSRLPTGRGGVGFVSGEAGIGKSTLLDAVLDECPYRVFRGAAGELSTGRPFAALVDALGGTPDAARQTVVDLLAGRSSPPAADADGLQYRLIEILLSYLERDALDAPLVLALDDLHWADPSTLQAVHVIGQRLARVPVALLGTFRPFPSPGPLSRVVRDLVAHDAVHVPLGPLDAEAVTALVDHLVGAVPSPGLLARLDGARGNPFYVRELVRALEADDALRRVDGRVEVDADAHVPASFRASVLAQLDALPGRTRHALRVAAVLGESFPLADLATVLDRRADAVLADLDEALRARLLDTHSAALTFRHALVREAIYLAQPPTVREALHVQAGRALAAENAPAPKVAAHFVRGAAPGDDAAVDWLRRAAETTAPRMLGAAVDLFERALAIASPGYPDRFGLMAQLVDALIWAGRYTAAADRAHQLLALDDDPDRRHRVQRSVLHAMVIAGRMEDGARELAEARRTFAGDAVDRLRFDVDAAITDVFTRDAAAALRLAEDALRRAEEHGDDELRQHANAAVCIAAVHTGAIPRALAAGRAAIGLGGGAGSPAHRYGAHIFLGTAFLEADRPDDADRVFRAGREISETAGTMWQNVCYLTQTGLLKFDGGRWDEAVAELTAASLTGQESAASPWILPEALLAVIALRRGELVSARDHVERAQRAYESGQRFGAEIAFWATALLEEADGKPESALGLLTYVWQYNVDHGLASQNARIALDLTRLTLAAGHDDRAADVAADLTALATTTGVPSRRALAETCCGLAAHDLDRARDGVARYAGTPRVAERLQASLLVGRALAADPARRDDAVRLLAPAHTLGTDVDAKPAAAEAAALLRTLGAPPGPRATHVSARTGWDSLTGMELRVAKLTPAGETNNQMGARLHVSGRTVESHLTHVYAKLGLTCRAQLVAAVIRRFPELA